MKKQVDTMKVNPTQRQVSDARAHTRSPQGFPSSGGVYELELVSCAEVGPEQSAEHNERPGAGAVVVQEEAATLPTNGLSNPRVWEAQDLDGRYHVLQYDASDPLVIFMQCPELNTMNVQLTRTLATSHTCHHSSVPAIEDLARESVAKVAGTCPHLELDVATVFAELHGVRAEQFIKAYKREQFVCQDECAKFVEGPASAAHLHFRSAPVQMLISNNGTEQTPVCRVTLRIARDFFAEHDVHTIGDFVKEAGFLTQIILKNWCRCTETGNPKAPVTQLWAAVQKCFAAWAQQLARSEGQKLVYRSSPDVKVSAT
jgi:hypothetical protein